MTSRFDPFHEDTVVVRRLLTGADLGLGYSCAPPEDTEHPHQMWRRGLAPSRYGLRTPSRRRRGR